MRGRVDQRTVEAGGLGIQGQHELLLLKQGFGVRLRVGFPLGQWDDAPPAQRVSPGRGAQVNPRPAGGLLPSSCWVPPSPAHSLFAFFINVIDLIPAEQREHGGCGEVRGASPGVAGRGRVGCGEGKQPGELEAQPSCPHRHPGGGSSPSLQRGRGAASAGVTGERTEGGRPLTCW